MILHFSHANGFPAACYRKMFSYLDRVFEIGYINMIGHDPQRPVTERWPTAHQFLPAFVGKDDAIYAVRTAEKHRNLLGRRSIPQPSGVVSRRRDDARPVGAEGGGKHEVLMAAQDRDLVGARGVPDAGGLVP